MKKAPTQGRRTPTALTKGQRWMAAIAVCCVTLAVIPAGRVQAAMVPESRVRFQEARFDPQWAIETANAAPVNWSGTAAAPAVMIDMKIMKSDAPVILEAETSRTLVPVRFLAEGFGATVRWDPVFRTVSVEFRDRKVVIAVGAQSATVNGERVALDQAPFIRYDRVYVPLRFVAEVLGAQVDWVGEEPPYWATDWSGQYQIWIWHPDGYWGPKGLRERIETRSWFSRD